MWAMIKGMFGSKGYELIAMLAIAAVIAVVIGLTAYNNYQAGYQAATLKFEKEAKQGLQVQLERLNQQLETANQTNLTVLKKVGEYQMLGEQTTDELQKILAKTAAMRVGCTFDTDSLRAVENSRQRAVSAATGGFGAAVRSAAETNRK